MCGAEDACVEQPTLWIFKWPHIFYGCSTTTASHKLCPLNGYTALTVPRSAIVSSVSAVWLPGLWILLGLVVDLQVGSIIRSVFSFIPLLPQVTVMLSHNAGPLSHFPFPGAVFFFVVC